MRLAALGVLLASLVSCGGSEFSSDGQTGGNNSGGSSSSGGSGGSSGSGGGVDAGTGGSQSSCPSDLLQKSCMDPLVTTGNAVCNTCVRGKCCAPINTCLVDDLCARELRCYLESCMAQSAAACLAASCPTCSGASSAFLGVSTCLASNCTPDCPMLIP